MKRLMTEYDLVCDTDERALILKDSFNEPDETTGKTLLHWACASKDPKLDVFDFILDHGADIEARDAKGRTALMIAGRTLLIGFTNTE